MAELESKKENLTVDEVETGATAEDDDDDGGDDVESPFAAEYAKSARSSCRQCKKSIEKGALRVALVVRSTQYGGNFVPNWYHRQCFFETNRIKSVDDVKDFGELTPEDQEWIKERIIPHGHAGIHAGVKADDPRLVEYKVDTAKSARSVCRLCKEKIAHGQVRIMRLDKDSDKAKRFGPAENWHHLRCFGDKRDEFEFYAGGHMIPGFDAMKAEDQEQIKSTIPIIKKELPGLKKATAADVGQRPVKKLKKTK